MSDAIKNALTALDPKNDAHWTSDNLPRLDVMKELAGVEVSRADIQAISKTFNRKNPVIEEAPVQDKPSVVTPAEEEATQDVPEVAPEVTAPIVESDADVDKAVEVEYEKAGQALIAARKRYARAQEAMDEVIARREKEAEKITFADTVKQFQESQRKQREARAGNAKALAEALKATDSSKV